MEIYKLIKTRCAICKSYDGSKLIYEANLDAKSFSVEVFSARRIPDRRHYAWVRCKNCNLLRSDPVSDINLGELYRDSSFDYSDEVHGLSRTYGKIVKKALGSRKPTGSILEIGGGTSFFLEEAIRIGFTKVSGVEPSKDSVRSTRADIKPFVTLGLMQEDLFPENSFDVVTMFHVMDHLPSPLETVKSCVSTLKVGGIFISAVHNEKSWSSRLFGEKSPIFDVEHTYLYSKKTAIALFKKAGLSEIRAYAYFNFYSLAYLLHLIPIPIKIKKLILNSKVGDLLSKVKLYVPLGNIFIVGKK